MNGEAKPAVIPADSGKQVRQKASGDSSRSQVNSDPFVDAAVTALMVQVGKRVYAARKEKGMSRRELCEQSGVSPRYLATLESGEGNISIALLLRLAIALERSIDKLVSIDDALSDDVARLIDRFRNTDEATRAQVLRLLDPAQLRERKAERIALIGLRGAGKSTLGNRLCEAMDVPFVELNKEIERSAGIPIGEIIALYGEEGYRKLEADTLQSIISSRTCVVLAIAGGVVENSNTFSQVLGRFHTIWLKADPTEHMGRVRAQGDLRPMADNPNAMQQLKEILFSRESRYSQAEYQLDTTGKSVKQSLSDLKDLVITNDLFEKSTS